MAEFLAAWWWIDRWRKSTAYTDMTLAEQGAYRNLLDELWLRGDVIPSDERILAKISGAGLDWPSVRKAVLARFYATPEGLRNETHDEVAAQSRERRDFFASGGKARAAKAERGADGRFLPSALDQQAGSPAGEKVQQRVQPPSPSPSPSPEQSPTPEESVPRKERSSRSPTRKHPPPGQEALSVAQYLRDAILEHAPDHACGKNGVADKWARDIDLAIRRDKRTPEALKAAIDFAHRREDAFWRPNIQSGKKLRAQFDTLQAQAARTSRRAKALPENVAAVNSWLHRHGVDPDAERR